MEERYANCETGVDSSQAWEEGVVLGGFGRVCPDMQELSDGLGPSTTRSFSNQFFAPFILILEARFISIIFSWGQKKLCLTTLVPISIRVSFIFHMYDLNQHSQWIARVWQNEICDVWASPR